MGIGIEGMKYSGSIPARGACSRRVSRWAAAFRNCARGSVAIELALLAQVLAAILLGSIDLGTYIYEKMQMQSAARAGAQYAVQSDGNYADTAGISTAVLASSTDLETSVTVTSKSYCACADGSETALSASLGCSGTCTGGDTPALTVRITVTNTFTPIFPYPGIPDNIVLTGVSSLRVP